MNNSTTARRRAPALGIVLLAVVGSIFAGPVIEKVDRAVAPGVTIIDVNAGPTLYRVDSRSGSRKGASGRF